jgi:hypothetical protein
MTCRLPTVNPRRPVSALWSVLWASRAWSASCFCVKLRTFRISRIFLFMCLDQEPLAGGE